MLYHVLVTSKCGFRELIQVKSNKELATHEELFPIVEDEDTVSLELLQIDDIQIIEVKN